MNRLVSLFERVLLGYKQKMLMPVLALVCLLSVGCASVTQSAVKLDSDVDSIADENDVCPGTPAGDLIDDSGCSLFSGTIEGVEFLPGDYRLLGSSRTVLEELVSQLKSYPDVKLNLAGHTDNRGSAKQNLELSKQRVLAVVKFLVANGVQAERLRPFGFGESRPYYSNATEEGRMKNRRIEMSLLTQ